MRKTIAICGLLALAACTTPDQAKKEMGKLTATAYTPVAFDQAAEKAVMNKFAGVLKDPESLRFRNVKTTRATLKNGATSVAICGFYNSRNSFGAYAGYDPFAVEIVNGKAQTLVLDDYNLRNICYAANAVPDAL